MEIKTNSRVPTTPSIVQHVSITKPISPLRGGTSLEIIPLLVQTFTIHVQVATVTNELVRDNERYVKEDDKLVNPSYTILNSKVEPFELLYTNLPLTPH